MFKKLHRGHGVSLSGKSGGISSCTRADFKDTAFPGSTGIIMDVLLRREVFDLTRSFLLYARVVRAFGKLLYHLLADRAVREVFLPRHSFHRIA